MFYYYAHTSHKEGLESVRRGVACLKEAKRREVEYKLLVNDFRAALVAKELGIEGAVTIETIHDIDLVLERGDTLLIDSNEELPGQFESFCNDYKVFRMAQNCNEKPVFNEQIIYPWQEDTIFVDTIYSESLPKTKRVLFFGGDSDPSKSILKHKDFFSGLSMEILLGHYFFIDYEKELASIFDVSHESEEYPDLIRTSSNIITTSVQCAIESRISGANVIFVAQTALSECISILFKTYNISVVDDFNQNMMRRYLSEKIQIDPIIPINSVYDTFFSK
ncbi:MAG: hypothetical protein JXQ77_04715 [Campylobacterales bacterium]|nr:hypothetical protein [Campylobacterales bacterium]